VQNLSPNFTLEELVRSETAVRLGIDNTPSPEVVENLTTLAAYLEGVRARVKDTFGPGTALAVTSGYRSPAVNAAVGGKPTSYHCLGLAADVHVPGGDVLTLAREVAAWFKDYDQLIHEFGAWVHVGLPRPGEAPRVEQLTIGGHPAATRVGLLPL
jgi:hypothetical protein